MLKNKEIKGNLRFWGFAEAGESILANVLSTFIAIFLTDVVALPLHIAGMIMIFTSVTDFILASFAGGIISTLKPMKWGKLRSWLIIAPPLTAVSLIGYFSSFADPVLTAVVITLSFIIGKGIFFNLSWVANISLIPVISTDNIERTRLTSQRFVGFNFGKILSGYMAPLFLVFLQPLTGEKMSYQLLIIVCGIIMIGGYLIHFKITEGYECNSFNVNEKKEILSVKDIFGALAKNPQLIATLFIDLTSNLGSFFLPAVAVYVYKYVFENPAMLSLHLGFVGIGGLIGAYLSRYVVKKFNNRSFLLCIYPLVSLCLITSRFFDTNVFMFILINTAMQIFIGMCQPLELGLYMDNITYYKWRTGIDATSFIIGLSNLPVKIAYVLKSVLISFALATSGYVVGSASSIELHRVIINAYTIIPSIVPILGFIVLKFFYKLTPEGIHQMKQEINARL